MTKKRLPLFPKQAGIKTCLLGFFIILLLIPITTADPQLYQTLGVDRQNTYDQTEGNGVWTLRNPITYTRTYSNIQSHSPIVANVDNTTGNEIIIINDNLLTILNYTSETGLIEETSVNHGATSWNTTTFKVTPATFDYDSDGAVEIISMNGTHFLTFGWNGTEMVIEQSAPTGQSQQAVTLQTVNFPVIKCAQQNQWSSGNDTCVTIINNRTAGTQAQSACAYDVTSNNVQCTHMFNIPVSDNTFHNTHLVDSDFDGFLEYYVAYREIANGDLNIYAISVPATGTPTPSLVFQHNLANNYDFTDIALSNIDSNTGNGMEITWFYQASAQPDYEAYTISRTGTTIASSYFLNNPEGNDLAANSYSGNAQLISIIETFTQTADVVCTIIRSHDNTDKLVCVSRLIGSVSSITEYSSNTNFSTSPIIHRASLTGNGNILTPNYILSNDATVLSQPSYSTNGVIIPIDYQLNGLMDMISLNGTLLSYLDDGATNTLPVIVRQTVGTGNDVCVGVVQRLFPQVTDAENDTITCFAEQSFINGTKVQNSTNQSFSSPNVPELQLTQTTTGVYNVVTHCTDQFNTGFSTLTHVMVVSNDSTTCRQQDQQPSVIEVISDEDIASDDEFLGSWNAVLGNYNIDAPRAKAIVWLFIMAFVMLGSLIVMVKAGASGSMSFFATLLLTTIMLVMGWYFEMVSTVVLAMVGLTLAVVLTIIVTTRLVSEG